MRLSFIAVAALAFLRIVIGLHFFLEGSSHLRDPAWSSAGFRKVAVGPFANFLRDGLPEIGDWSGTLDASGTDSAQVAAAAWQESVVAGWKKLLNERSALVVLDAARQAEADALLAAATQELKDYVAPLAEDLADYRLQRQRLVAMEQGSGATEIPFIRERIAKKRRELAAQSSGWMKDAAAIGQKLVIEWDASCSAADKLRVAAAVGKNSLWKTDRFVSWSLLTIGLCLTLGILTKFNAMGGVFFLLSVIAAQPFWVIGAQATYDQWVELSALLVIAALPTGGWSGFDYYFSAWYPWCHKSEVHE